MLFRIHYDPNTSAGGTAPAASGAATASASPAPASSGERTGTQVITSFRDSLAKALTKNPESSQPPSDGNETPAGTGEGEDKGIPPSGDAPVTTADPGEDNPGEEQQGDEGKGWSAEELAELKAHGRDKIPFSADARALLKSSTELRRKFDEVSGSNSNLATRNTELEHALHAGDLKALQGMGFDLKIDQRTPDDHLKEIEEQYNGIKDTFAPLIEQLKAENPAVAQLLTKAAKGLLQGYSRKAELIAREQEKQTWKQEVLQEQGIKPSTDNAYQKLQAKAESHLTALTQQDPDAPKYFAELKQLTSQGGPLHALGLSIAKLYGSSQQTAKAANDIAKGLYLAKNMKTILADREKKWEKDFVKKSQTGGGGGRGPTPSTSTPSSLGTHMQGRMRAYMGQKQ